MPPKVASVGAAAFAKARQFGCKCGLGPFQALNLNLRLLKLSHRLQKLKVELFIGSKGLL